MVTTAAMRTAFEEIKNAVWNEATAHCQNMTIGIPMLMGAEEPQWLNQVQVLPGARHGDVKETAFFLDLFGTVDRHVGRDAGVRDVEHEYDVPLLALRRMDSRQHEIVLIEMRPTRLGAGSLGRIKVSSVKKPPRVA
jgi:hypothetical protein